MADDNGGARSRARMGVLVVLIGVGGLVAALVLVLYMKSDETGGTILGIVASPIAAIVASYFGITVARAASEDAGAARAEAGLAQLDKAQSIQAMRSTIQEVATAGPVEASEAARIAREAAERAQS